MGCSSEPLWAVLSYEMPLNGRTLRLKKQYQRQMPCDGRTASDLPEQMERQRKALDELYSGEPPVNTSGKIPRRTSVSWMRSLNATMERSIPCSPP